MSPGQRPVIIDPPAAEPHKSRPLVQVDLDEVLNLIKMAGLKAEVGREYQGDKIFIEVSGFQNAGDVFVLEGIVLGSVIT